MGEKIRDIHPIKIGDASLMIELNEGYTPSDGRLIHIQNNKYRYLLKEKDFYRICAMVMRSWSEFDYIKKKAVIQHSQKDFEEREPISEGSNKQLKDFACEFEKKNITYKVLDQQNKLITICIKETDIQEFENLIKNLGGKAAIHPFSQSNGYIFLYLMTPFMLYKLGNIYIEVYCQLPCASLTPKHWIPLDRIIQKRLWSLEERIDNVSWVDPISRYIFHLCWAIFHNNGFSSFERKYLSENKFLLTQPELKECLSMVFFNYTDLLINSLKNGDFDNIIPNYFHFIDY